MLGALKGAGRKKEEDHAENEVRVPDPEQPPAPVLAPELDPGEAGHHVMAEAEEERGEGAPDHAVDVQGTQPAEAQPGRAVEELGMGEFGGDDGPDGGEHEEPDEAPGQLATGELPIDEVVAYRETAIARSRAIRSSRGGCVENRFMRL